MSITVPRDAEGYLVNPEDWTMELAALLAEEEDIALTDRHWSVLHFVREYYNEHGIASDIRHVATHLAAANDCHKKEAKKIIFELFPYGYVKQTCKISGMKRPRAWSTG